MSAGAFVLTAPAAALANKTTSVNWAGYAAHRSGVRFRSVTGEWRIPAASCTAGSPGFSAVWLGLGGYSTSSNALEQTGTEIDCRTSGRATYFAWYELVPAGPRTISLGVQPGDVMRGAVSSVGGRVTIALSDLSDRRAFTRSFAPAQIDATSADWIVEAPSECNDSGRCITLPLTDFGSASLFAARATTSAGRSGTIRNRSWTSTKITLKPSGSGVFAGMIQQAAEAIPSVLTAGGSAFTVNYRASLPPGGQQGSSARLLAAHLQTHPAGELTHPWR